MPKCDLHTHSTFSDGTFTPSQLVSEALRLNLRAVALTDHNTIAGLPEFLRAAEGTSLQAVPGVEITTGYLGKEVHILGLFLERERYGELERFLSVITHRGAQSNRALVAALNHAGFDLDYAEILRQHQGTVNRAVIAAELLKKGAVRSISEAFHGILSAKHGYYVPPERVGAFDTIAFLHAIHAVPVLAHPFLNLTAQELRAFLPEAKAHGLAAMETRYATFSPETASLAHSIAGEFGLEESGGSDFHGENKPEIRLGSGTGTLAVPDSFFISLSAWKNSVFPSV